MISNIQTAEKIKELMLDVFRRVEESVSMVRETCTPAEAMAYKKAAVNVIGAVLMDVLEPLYETNPSLKPPGWDD